MKKNLIKKKTLKTGPQQKKKNTLKKWYCDKL